MNPIRRRTANTDGKIFSNDFHAFFNAAFVLFLSFWNEIKRPAIAPAYKIFVNIVPLLIQHFIYVQTKISCTRYQLHMKLFIHFFPEFFPLKQKYPCQEEKAHCNSNQTREL